jgi:hypothetical protein
MFIVDKDIVRNYGFTDVISGTIGRLDQVLITFLEVP